MNRYRSLGLFSTGWHFKLLAICFVLLVACRLSLVVVHASSQQAYQDYLFQFDQYRQKLTDFQVAKNEYLKFNTLTAQQTALDKTKIMLTQRDQLLRGYLLLLNEKLNEDIGMGSFEKQLYQTLINNEVGFLDKHSKLIDSIGSIEDGVSVSRELESHYQILSASIRQAITGISLGGLAVLSRQFDNNYKDAQAFVANNRGNYNLNKQSVLDRWLLQIANKRNLYQQKINEINSLNTQLKSKDIRELDKNFRDIQKSVAEGRQYLAEGSAFLGELINSLKYED